MLQNSLIEIGSKANVILRFKTETCVNGITYAANEPYLLFKDVNVIINYTNQDKTGNTDINVIANSDIKPRTVVMSGINFSRKLAALLATYKDNNQNYFPTEFVTLIAERGENDLAGVIYLTKAVGANDKIFVYDSNFQKINFTYNSSNNSISSASFLNDIEYLISFPTIKLGTKFDLNKPHIPYMSLEVQGVGNIDKVKKEVLMYFDKVSLNSLIEFTFIHNDLISVPLVFHIIEDKNNYVVFED
jgi:hypothetical protein